MSTSVTMDAWQSLPILSPLAPLQASWTTRSFKGPTPPTCVLVHGILGNRRNMSGLARMIVEQYPSWQVVLVDLRCHGESAGLAVQPPGSDSVASAAADILTVLRDLSLFPHMLIGHSFGGKVVMSMVAQFGRRLPRNVQVMGAPHHRLRPAADALMTDWH